VKLWKNATSFGWPYAAQGLPSDQGGKSGAQVRDLLQNVVRALTGLAEACRLAVEREALEPADKYLAFLAVLDRDARDSLAAIDLVLAQPTISSQLIDSLNASIHLRALLTDLFLVDEILKTQNKPAEMHSRAKASNLYTTECGATNSTAVHSTRIFRICLARSFAG
jgi:hypothetical protein